ncbi:MAG: VWA domain-containing protein [Planctomycetaceae bacterium]|nr:VWA domain-containing protein [Planctomycetaceae bacterium]
MQAYRATQPLSPRHGAVLVLMAILLPVVLVICLFSVNVAYMSLMRTELRVSTDAAARAASSTYSSTGNQAAAIDAAQEFALLNKVGGQGLVVDDADVEFGRSTQPSTGARYVFTVDNVQRNAARVNATAESRTLFAGGLFANATFSPTKTATATFDDVDICLVLDRSSSMKLYTWETSAAMSTSDPRFCQVPSVHSRWRALSNAVGAFVEVLEDSGSTEHLAVVTYASTYKLPCNPSFTSPQSRIDSNLSSDLANALNAMTTLNTTNWGGNTDIDAGVITGRSVLTNTALVRPHARKVMIVLTDGHYTGADPVPQAATAKSQGITVHSVTFGDGANQQAMQDLATAGGGTFHHAPDPETLESVFRKLAAMSVLLTD